MQVVQRVGLERLKGMGVPIVPDLPAHEGFGPLAGIEAGMLSTKAEKVGVVACDLPNADPKLIAWLAGKLGDYEAVVPVVDPPQPLRAVYSRSCLPKLVAQLESEDKSVKAFLKQVKVAYVPESEWTQIADPKSLTVHLNEPKDLEGLNELAREVRFPIGRVLGFVGFSGSGKTTVTERLTKALTAKGYKVGVVKHHAHLDEEGKDSWRHQKAGAEIVGLVTPEGMALFLPEKGLTAEDAVEKLLHQESVDLVLVEGFKGSSFPKMVVLPKDIGEREAKQCLEDLLAQMPNPETVIGIISAVDPFSERQFPNEPKRIELPLSAHDDTEGLADFVEMVLMCEGDRTHKRELDEPKPS